MAWHKYLLYPGIFALTLGVELFNVSLAAPQVKDSLQKVASVAFPPASRRGAPSRTAGGGQRGSECVNQDNPPLTVLAPADNLGTTVAANPTLYWYIPQTQAKSAQFVVFDQQEDEVYQTKLGLKGVSGVVKLSLPETVSLTPGKRYRWVLSLNCSTKDKFMNPFVMGNLQRTELSDRDKTKLAATKEPLKQAEVYAGARIWQETLTLVAQQRQIRPNDPNVMVAWKELLKSVELDAIVNEPLLDCCTVE